MIPNNNPFRKLGKFESYVAAFMAEDDKKPLIKWFDKFEKVLKKLGTDYKKSSINPTDALEYYYDKKSPEEAAKALAESVEQVRESVEVDEAKAVTFKVTPDYEFDGEKNVDVPKTLKIRVDARTMAGGYEEVEEYISDAISDETGWLHNGFTTKPDIEKVTESDEIDEYIKKDGARKRCAGGDGRRTDVEVTELSRDEPEVVFDFKSERDAKQFAKDVENSAVGLANKGVERYKGKYRVVITGMTKDMHKKAIGKYAHKNKGEFSHSTSEVTPKGYGPYDESNEVDEAESIPLVRTGQGSYKKDTHPSDVERLYQAKDKKEYEKLMDAGTSALTKGMIAKFGLSGDYKKYTVNIKFKDEKSRKKFEKSFGIKESVYETPHADNLGTGARMSISDDEKKLLDFINKNW